MRRHEKKGITRGDVQGVINQRYRDEQVKRTPWNGKYPGCYSNGSVIAWAPSDRFRELNVVAYERRYFKYRFHREASLETRLEGKLRLLRMFRFAQRADKPRLP